MLYTHKAKHTTHPYSKTYITTNTHFTHLLRLAVETHDPIYSCMNGDRLTRQDRLCVLETYAAGGREVAIGLRYMYILIVRIAIWSDSQSINMLYRVHLDIVLTAEKQFIIPNVDLQTRWQLRSSHLRRSKLHTLIVYTKGGGGNMM